VSVSIPDLTAISAINTVLKEEETLWDTYIGQAAQTPEEKIDGRLRQLSCVRRIAWTSAGESGQSFAAKAMNLAKELIAMGPKDANAHFAYGQVLLEKNDRLAAAKEFETAHSLGMDSPALNRIISALSGKAELTDIRPATGLRIFGAKALFRCTVRGIDMNSIKEFNMTMDGHPVAAVRAGSQILYVPQEAELSDGKHVVKISLTPTDAETKTMDAEFYVNKRPPTWTVTPSGPDIIALQPVWTIALDDLAGIDRLTLKVTLKKVSGGYSKVLINEGRYKEPSSVGKLGGTVDTASFKVSPPAELTPGDYTLDISVQNLAGIPLNDSKKYNIK
jgi:hypothetical protein